MLATGDFVVPRQQGRVFPERPPMTMWAIAAAGWLRGEVDAIAVRLPSVVAVVLTSVLIYVYARLALPYRLKMGRLYSPAVLAGGGSAAFAAALVYPTMGQVLQIGRMGESEALFALLVSASLLVWHLGYMRHWPPLATWACGFAIAALAALVKGPQAPVYFVAITAVYLGARRDWRYLVSWQYAAAACVFAAIVAAWQIPFYLATDTQAVVATWSGLAADRIHLGGLAKHVLTYPLETFACLLPWSPLLVALLRRETRALLELNPPLATPDEGGEGIRPVTTFLCTALLVAYPTVWIAAGARGRYFMPLYPLVAVVAGMVIERCAAAPVGGYPRRAWHQFLLLCGLLIGAGGAVVGGMALLPFEWGNALHQPRWFGVVFAAMAASAAYVLWRCYRLPRLAPEVAVLTVATVVGVAYGGLVISTNVARWNDPTPAIARFRQHLPPGAALVSFSPIEHRFAYYYGGPIAELDWPRAIDDLPAELEYFCFMRNPGDTAERRAAGRGRTWTTTPGTLPFAWQELDAICVERRLRDEPQRTVVLGCVVRPLRAAVSDVTSPQRSTAQKPSARRK
jgi:4-amino-4-deoxy-L-arabinose transferase-like glycosyltransferase